MDDDEQQGKRGGSLQPPASPASPAQAQQVLILPIHSTHLPPPTRRPLAASFTPRASPSPLSSSRTALNGTALPSASTPYQMPQTELGDELADATASDSSSLAPAAPDVAITALATDATPAPEPAASPRAIAAPAASSVGPAARKPPPAPLPPTPPPAPRRLYNPAETQQLMDMGFARADAERALVANSNDVQRAAAMLIDGGGGGNGDTPAARNPRESAPEPPSSAPAPAAVTPSAAAPVGPLREFELSFDASVPMGIALQDLDVSNAKTSVDRARLPPAGFAVVVGAVQPGSTAEELNLKPGVAITAINGESLQGLSRKEVLVKLVAVKRGERRLTFYDYAGVQSRLDELRAELSFDDARLES